MKTGDTDVAPVGDLTWPVAYRANVKQQLLPRNELYPCPHPAAPIQGLKPLLAGLGELEPPPHVRAAFYLLSQVICDQLCVSQSP